MKRKTGRDEFAGKQQLFDVHGVPENKNQV
jgi:hypothetical protein